MSLDRSPPSRWKRSLQGTLIPPLGLVRAWRNPSSGWGRKVLASLVLLLVSLIYLALFIGLLVLGGVISLEWRGGFPPVLTFHETVPDYEALETHRETIATAPPAASTHAQRYEGGAYWTGFRGPQRDGRYDEMPIRTDWPADGLPPLWKQPIGGGYGSFAIVHGLAYTIEQRREREAVVAYDVLTGREVWNHDYPARFEESMGGEGPRSTPTWDDGRLYVLGAMGNFFCLDAKSGDVLWSHQMLDDWKAANLYFGCSASPLVVDDTVVVVGGEGTHALFAFDKLDGELRWRSVNEKPAYVSPMLVTLAGRRQLLAPTAFHAMGVDPADGTVLWKFPWTVQHDLTIAQPLITASNRFVLSAGYGKGAVAVRVDESGTGLSAQEVWSSRFLKNKFTSSVLHEGYIYGLDESILTCLDADTGERQWKDGRYDYGQLILAGEHLVILSGRGELALARATPERHEEVAIFQAIEGKTWNHPAIGDGYLLIRNAVEMACFDVASSVSRRPSPAMVP